jgi:hypothetical protein
MKKLIGLIGICFLYSSSLLAQNWGGGVDDDAVHFGFTFQYLSSEYKILKKPDWREPFRDENGQTFLDENGLPVSNRLMSIQSEATPGFGIGFVSNYRLSENSDLRFTPTLVFNTRKLIYQYDRFGDLGEISLEKQFVNKEVNATLVELPLSIKLKSDRRQNFRAYVLGGAKYTMSIAKKKKDDGDPPMLQFLKNRKQYFSYEAGFGLDFYFEYFKMSPEIKLSYSMNNLLDNKSPNPFNQPIDRLMLRHVTFSLFFE